MRVGDGLAEAHGLQCSVGAPSPLMRGKSLYFNILKVVHSITQYTNLTGVATPVSQSCVERNTSHITSLQVAIEYRAARPRCRPPAVPPWCPRARGAPAVPLWCPRGATRCSPVRPAVPPAMTIFGCVSRTP